MKLPAKDILALLVSTAICFAAAGLGSQLTVVALEPWYAGLKKPAFNPPDWVFGPVWSLLYLLMAISAWLVWRQRERAAVRLPLALFGVQLALNVAWSGCFFYLQRPGAALSEIAVLWLAILATMLTFFRVNRAAGALLVPYLLWVSFASVLNFAIWRLNA
jgi:tryptophan-rich sensory protein